MRPRTASMLHRCAALCIAAVGLFAPAAPALAQCPSTWFAGTGAIGEVGTDNQIFALTSLPNGDLVAGGAFLNAGGVAATRLVRITNPLLTTRTWQAIGAGANAPVRAFVVRPNGDLIVAGDFTSAGGIAANRIASVNLTTGVWSTLGSGLDNSVSSLVTLPDGDLVAVGLFANAGGQFVSRVARYDFDTAAWSSMGGFPDSFVNAAIVLPSGDMVVGGNFSSISTPSGTVQARRIARWNAASNTWSPLGTSTGAQVTAFALLPGGDLLVGSDTNNGTEPSIARVNPVTGARSTPPVWPNGTVNALHAMADGSVVVGGNFSMSIGSVAVNHLARLVPGTWTWRIVGPTNSPANGPNAQVRAFASAGVGNSLFVGGLFTSSPNFLANRIARVMPGYETVAVSQPPVSQTVCAGTAVTFSVGGISGGNLTYQWQFNGTNIAGATGPTYTFTNAQASRAGSYTCVVTSVCPSGGTPVPVTTPAATLTVSGVITTQPATQTIIAGQTLSLNVAINSAPATYQWRRNGVNISAASNPSAATDTLTIPNATFADTAAYSCVITTPCGNITSATANVRVNCPSAFTAPAFLTAGANPSKAATADLNGDGLVDAIISNAVSSDLSVFLSNGDGTFQPPVNYPAGGRPGDMAIADFNADGRPDVAVACFATASVVLFGGPGGTLSAPVFIGGSAQFTGIAAGDFNGDDRPDLVITQGPANRFFISVNNGDGTFGAPLQRSTAAGGAPGPVLTGDFNRDGRTDLVMGTSLLSGSISVYTGNGDTTFTGSPVVIAAGGVPTSLAIDDFDANLFIDVVASIDSAGTAALFLGNGNATFQARADYPVGNTPNAIATGDFNGDGAPDIAVVNHLASTVTVRLGNRSATNTFGPAESFPEGDRPFGMAIGDFNSDGRPDVITANYWGDNVAVLLSTSSLPAITQQSDDLTTCIGQNATFTVAVSSPSTVSYQWRKNGLPIPGATGASLSLSNLQPVTAGEYDCVVSNACGFSISRTMKLVITGVCACSVADIVGIGGSPGSDGLLTGDDFNFFIASFASGAPLADIVSIGGLPPGDGLITGDDFNAFIASFAAGCP